MMVKLPNDSYVYRIVAMSLLGSRDMPVMYQVEGTKLFAIADQKYEVVVGPNGDGFNLYFEQPDPT